MNVYYIRITEKMKLLTSIILFPEKYIKLALVSTWVYCRLKIYSTVTLLARLRGWSTLHPRITAM